MILYMIMSIIMIVTLTIFHNIKSQLSLIGLSEHLPYHFGITKYAYAVHGEMGKNSNTEKCKQ